MCCSKTKVQGIKSRAGVEPCRKARRVESKEDADSSSAWLSSSSEPARATRKITNEKLARFLSLHVLHYINVDDMACIMAARGEETTVVVIIMGSGSGPCLFAPKSFYLHF